MQRFFPLVLVLAAILVLAACGRAPTDPTPQNYVISGTAVSPEPEFVAMGAALLMVDRGAIGPAEVLEVVPGAYSSEVVPVAADGSFELPLPTADVMPADVLTAASDFFAFGGVECSLNASVPAAQVSQYYLQGGFMLFPGVVFLSLFGTAFSFPTIAPVDFEGDDITDHTIVNWLFATEDVTVSSGEAGCDLGEGLAHIDVHLKAGWNQVGLSFERDPDTDDVVAIHLNNDDHEQVYFNVTGPL